MKKKLPAGYDTVYPITMDKNVLVLAAGETLDKVLASIQAGVSGLSLVAVSGRYEDLIGKPVFHAVAFSGDYNALNNKPASLPANGGAADTAARLATARNIGISGDVAGTATAFNGTANITIPAVLASVARSNTASAAAPAAGATFTALDGLTTDAKGRVTGVNTKTVTLPANASTVAGYGVSATHKATGAWIPLMASSGGALEIGQYIDLHRAGSTTDYDYRINLGGAGDNRLYLSNAVTVNGNLTATTINGAVYNDYAEYRRADQWAGPALPGRCVTEAGDGAVRRTARRLEKCPMIVSDTFGFAIGDQAHSVAVAVAGRALAYTDRPRGRFKPGDAVCAGKDGTVSKMRFWERILYPDRMVGVVSEVPDYERWGTGNVRVDGRVWIKVR
jgi:hypothetical protein